MSSKARELANLGNAYSDGALSNRNLIINGAMQVAQRGTSAAGVTTGGYFSVDRWRTAVNALGTWTIFQDTSSPVGFATSIKALCTTADGSPASGDYMVIQQRIEAQNLQPLGFGTSGAKDMTLSFWVKSNKTGSGSIEIINSDNSDRSAYPSYTINSADTWEYKTVTISGDTTGGPANDNGTGFEVAFWLNSGSSFTGGSHTTSFGTFTSANRNASNLAVGGSTNDYWQITGVQLEVGDTATPFEHRSYGQELALCQRYYLTFGGTAYQGYSLGECNSVNVAVMVKNFPNDMRVTPTFTYSGNFRVREAGSAHDVDNGLTLSVSSPQSCVFIAEFTTSVLAVGNACRFYNNNDANARLNFDAEL